MSLARSPRVSVVIPVYNRERYVREAIESILAQTFRDFELVLIDDGSTDRSLEVMSAYADPRIRVVSNARNLGIPQTRNRGLELATGDYLAWLDSDDHACPDRLEREVAFLDANPGIALVGSWTGAMDADSRPLKKVKTLPTSPGEVWAQLLFRCCILQYSVMARTDVLRQYGFCEDFPVSQDFDLFVRLGERHKMANIPRVLARRRLHGGRVTRERVALVKEKNLEIVAKQLAALGVEYTAEDLENHFALPRLRKLAVRPDAAYLDWVEAWLLKLQEANRRSRRYPEHDLRTVAGKAWLRAWINASASARRSRWGRLLRSPLRRSAMAGLGSWVAQGLSRYLATDRRLPQGSRNPEPGSR